MSDHRLYIDNVSGRPAPVHGSAGASFNTLLAWQPSSLSYVAVTLDQSGNVNVTTGGGGGGGAVTVADGADVAQGATTDLAVTSDVNGTNSGKLRGLVKIFASVWDSLNGRLKVDGSAVTQPISAAALPLPAGAATSAGLTTINTTLGTPFQAGGSIGNTSFAISGSLPTGTNAIGGVTQSGTWNVSFTSPQHVIVDSATLGTVTVTGALTDTQLRATAVPISASNLDVALSTRLKPADTLAGVTIVGSVTSITNPVAITAAALPLPSGAALEAGHLAAIDTTLAEIAIDTDNLATIATAQATAAKQDTGNASLATIATNTTGVALDASIAATQPRNISQIGGASLALGRTVAASSIPVVLASDQANSISDNAVISRLDTLIQLQLETRNASILMLNIMARRSVTEDDLRWK